MYKVDALELLRISVNEFDAYVDSGIIRKNVNNSEEIIYDNDDILNVLEDMTINGRKGGYRKALELITNFDYALSDSLEWHEIPLGIKEDDGNPYIWNVLKDEKTQQIASPNCLIEKSVVTSNINLQSVILAHLMNKQKELPIWIYFVRPYKSDLFDQYDRLSGIRCVATGKQEFRLIVKNLSNEVNKRVRWLNKNNLTAFPVRCTEFPPIFVFVNYYNDILQETVTDFFDTNRLSFVLAMSHQTNIHFVYANSLMMELGSCTRLFFAKHIDARDSVQNKGADGSNTKFWDCSAKEHEQDINFHAFDVPDLAVPLMGSRDKVYRNKSKFYLDAIKEEFGEEEKDDFFW